MSKNIAVKLHDISKIYKLYDKPVDRLKEALHPLKKIYYKEFYALKNINLEIKKGEVIGIVGVNGAGKSTLLKIIAGVLAHSSGRVNIYGKVNAILELGSGLKNEMSGVENIKLNLQINGIYNNTNTLTEEIIKFADIGEHIHQPIKTYSSGMKARLGFAIATSTDPDILIVDEVLAVGDVLFQRKCYTKIEKLFKDGKTVIFVSHSAQSVIEFCSRAVLLYDREIIMDDTPKKVTEAYQKLVFSKDKQKVVNAIKCNRNIEIKKDEIHIEETEIQNSAEDDYLENFKSTPEIQDFGYDSVFSDFKILNHKNKLVNILNHGEEYTFEFIAKIGISGTISVGNQIVTHKGLIISGASLGNKKKNYSHTGSNNRIRISSKFKCYLSEGTYFINASSSIFKVDGYKPLHRVLNAYVFKVNLNDRSFVGRGYVDLEQEIKVKDV